MRLVFGRSGARPSLEGATCRRTLCPDGTLLETVAYTKHNDGPDLTDEEIEQWIESFPVQTLRT
jgi:hypothetical protein